MLVEPVHVESCRSETRSLCDNHLLCFVIALDLSVVDGYNQAMKRCLLTWLCSVALLLLWGLGYVWNQYPAQPHLYVQIAPAWHIGLFVLWFGVQVYAGVCFVYWIWARQLRRQHLA